MPASAVNTTTATSQMLANTSATTSGTATRANPGTDPNAAQDRFLTLLVAQLNNQDPLNPMDNAQITSQMAQINTVTGIQQVNQTLKAMADQVNAMQVLQGASLVGHDVVVAGSTLTLQGDTARGGMELAANADAVKVDVLSPGGQVIDTLNLGPMTAGRQEFTWTNPAYANRADLSFKVSATAAGKTVEATAQTHGKVVSVGTGSNGLTLQLAGWSKPVGYSQVLNIL